MSEKHLVNRHHTKLRRKYRSWLWLSIVVTGILFLPAGIAGMIYSAKAVNRFNKENYAGAERLSEIAAYWAIAGLILGVVYFVVSYLFDFCC